MRVLIAGLCLLFSFSAFAASEYLSDLNQDYCRDARFSRSGDTAFCKVAGGAEVLDSEFGPTYNKAPAVVPNLSAVDLGVLPDDSTSMLYSYTKPLLSKRTKKLVGYAVLEGYRNSEIGIRVKVLVKYNLRGKVVSISAQEY